MIKISIIVPVYNAERTLEQCIDSIVQSDFLDYELLLINDGSKDKSKQIIDSYQEKYPNIKAYHKDNQGVAATRNLGIESATGEYILFVDSDDWLEGNALSILDRVITTYEPDIVGFNSFIEKVGEQVCSKQANIEQYGEGENIKKVIGQLSIPFIWDKLFKRSIILKHKIRFDKELSYSEDTLFLCDYLMQIQNVMVLPNYLYHYRNNEGDSLSTRYVQNIDFTLEQIASKHQIICKRYPTYQVSLNQSLFYQTMCLQVIYNLYHDQCPLDAYDRKIKLKTYMSNELYKQINSGKPTSWFKKTIIFLYKLKNPFIMDICLTFLKVMRKKYKQLH